MNDNTNIAEILKDCPKGMELDCLMYDNVTLEYVDIDCIYPIRITTKSGYLTNLTEYGQNIHNKDAKCVIFPKGKTTWEGFVPPCNFNDGDIVFYRDTIAIFKEWGDETLFRTHVVKYLHCDSIIDVKVPLFGKNVRKEIRFATEEEKKKLFKAIKDYGYQWYPETKTLEKEEKKDKFDITALKPFDKVLVRNKESGHWMMEFFERVYENSYLCYKGFWDNCVPYWGNEHLLGTTDDCDDYYKIWKDETDE